MISHDEIANNFGPLCERCKMYMVRTFEASQSEGKWRRKDECPQCHARQWKLIDEGEKEHAGSITLTCTVCGKRVAKLYSKGDELICMNCKLALEEDDQLSKQYKDECKC